MCLTCHKHRPHLGKATPNGTTASPLVLHHERMYGFLRGWNARSDVHVVYKVAVPWQLSTKSTDTTVKLRGADRRNARLYVQWTRGTGWLVSTWLTRQLQPCTLKGFLHLKLFSYNTSSQTIVYKDSGLQYNSDALFLCSNQFYHLLIYMWSSITWEVRMCICSMNMFIAS